MTRTMESLARVARWPKAGSPPKSTNSLITSSRSARDPSGLPNGPTGSSRRRLLGIIPPNPDRIGRPEQEPAKPQGRTRPANRLKRGRPEAPPRPGSPRHRGRPRLTYDRRRYPVESHKLHGASKEGYVHGQEDPAEDVSYPDRSGGLGCR